MRRLLRIITGVLGDLILTPKLTNLSTADVKLKEAVTGVSYSEETGKVTVSAEELNKKNHDEHVKFTLESKTDNQIKQEYDITVKKVTVAVKNVAYDLNTKNTLTVTLDKKYPQAVLDKLNWEIKLGSNSIFQTGVTKGEIAYNNDTENTVVNVGLTVEPTATFKTDGLNVSDALGLTATDAANKVEVSGLSGTIKLTKKEAGIAIAEATGTTLKVTFNDWTEDEVEALKTEIASTPANFLQ